MFDHADYEPLTSKQSAAGRSVREYGTSIEDFGRRDLPPEKPREKITPVARPSYDTPEKAPVQQRASYSQRPQTAAPQAQTAPIQAPAAEPRQQKVQRATWDKPAGDAKKAAAAAQIASIKAAFKGGGSEEGNVIVECVEGDCKECDNVQLKDTKKMRMQEERMRKIKEEEEINARTRQFELEERRRLADQKAAQKREMEQTMAAIEARKQAEKAARLQDKSNKAQSEA